MRARSTRRRRAAGARPSGASSPSRACSDFPSRKPMAASALVLEPYLATVVIAGGFLRHGGSAEQKTAHIPGIIDGSKTFAFAQLEKNSRYDLSDVATSAK